MKTFVTVSGDGDVVADNKAMDFAKKHIGHEVTVGTEVMFTAFRVLRLRGDIKDLIVCFKDGEQETTLSADENGRFSEWPKNEVIDTFTDFLAELVGYKDD